MIDILPMSFSKPRVSGRRKTLVLRVRQCPDIPIILSSYAFDDGPASIWRSVIHKDELHICQCLFQ